MEEIIVYYRTNIGDPDASGASLLYQRALVEDALAGGKKIVVKEYISEEHPGEEAAAWNYAMAILESCAPNLTTILIPLSSVIGNGNWLDLTAVSCPFVLWELRAPPTPFAQVIRVPDLASEGLFLFQPRNSPGSRAAIYLCNRSQHMREITAICQYYGCDSDEPLAEEPDVTFFELEPGFALLVNTRCTAGPSDLMAVYRVRWTASDGDEQRAVFSEEDIFVQFCAR
ncbi:hypothetical protein [Pararhizobium sp. PWRC1-1]|uniref:hypothetical protein n=1 Tax=Pararhizobium sp. PWRC1-1 TaxID=2804566 RepID=UPI003CEC9ACF